MLARWTGLMERSTSVDTRSEALETADFGGDLDCAFGGFLDIRCLSPDMDRVVCVKEEGLVATGREGAISMVEGARLREGEWIKRSFVYIQRVAD